MYPQTTKLTIKTIEKYDGQSIWRDGKICYELGSYLGGGASGSVYQAIDLTELINEDVEASTPSPGTLGTRGGNSQSHTNLTMSSNSTSSLEEKSVAIKILNPVGYKNLPYSQVTRCVPAWKGKPLSMDQKCGKVRMNEENVWWLVHTQTKQIYAAYEDPQRGQLRELPLPRAVEVWGFDPFRRRDENDVGIDGASNDQAGCGVREGRPQRTGSFTGNIIFGDDIGRKNVSNRTVTVGGATITLPIVAPKYLKWLQMRQNVCREMGSMYLVGDHPNIIELRGVMELIQDSKSTLFLILELINGGELFERMHSVREMDRTDAFARKYFTQLLSGIAYCHSRGVVHRDLKPENLLLSDPSEGAILKIADFGLSTVVFTQEQLGSGSGDEFASVGVNPRPTIGQVGQDAWAENSDSEKVGLIPNAESPPPSPPGKTSATVEIGEDSFKSGSSSAPQTPLLQQQQEHTSLSTPVGAPQLRRLTSVVGSPHYTAPEVTASGGRGYDGRAVDTWSAGVILYSLLTKSLPFGSDLAVCARYRRYKQWLAQGDAGVLSQDGSGSIALPSWFFPPSVSLTAAALVIKLLQATPSNRITIHEALEHPWTKGEDVADPAALLKLFKRAGGVDKKDENIQSTNTSENDLSQMMGGDVSPGAAEMDSLAFESAFHLGPDDSGASGEVDDSGSVFNLLGTTSGNKASPSPSTKASGRASHSATITSIASSRLKAKLTQSSIYPSGYHHSTTTNDEQDDLERDRERRKEREREVERKRVADRDGGASTPDQGQGN